MQSQPTIKEASNQTMRILLHLRGRPPLTAATIKEELNVPTNMISARCSDMELFGLLDVSEVIAIRNGRTVPLKAYRLSRSGLDVLMHSEPQRIVRAAVRVMASLNEERALAFARAKQQWRMTIATETRAAIHKAFSEKLDGGT